jgi:hypothetical protein
MKIRQGTLQLTHGYPRLPINLHGTHGACYNMAVWYFRETFEHLRDIFEKLVIYFINIWTSDLKKKIRQGNLLPTPWMPMTNDPLTLYITLYTYTVLEHGYTLLSCDIWAFGWSYPEIGNLL